MTINANALQFTYGEADIPVVTKGGGRTASPNPHRDIVLHLLSLVGTDSTEKRARTFAVPHIDAEGNVIIKKDDDKNLPSPVVRALQQLREVGEKHRNEDGSSASFSVRTSVKPGEAKIGTGAKSRTVPTSIVTFWIHTTEVDGKTVPARITRTVKN